MRHLLAVIFLLTMVFLKLLADRYDLVDKALVKLLAQFPSSNDSVEGFLFQVIIQTHYIIKIRQKLLKVLMYFDYLMTSDSDGYNFGMMGIDDAKQILLTVTITTQSNTLNLQMLDPLIQAIRGEALLLRKFLDLHPLLNGFDVDMVLVPLKLVDLEFKCFCTKLECYGKDQGNRYLGSNIFRWLSEIKDKLIAKAIFYYGDLIEDISNIGDCYYHDMIQQFAEKSESFVAILRRPEEFVSGINSFATVYSTEKHYRKDLSGTWKHNLVSLLMQEPGMKHFYDKALNITFFVKALLDSPLMAVIVFSGHIPEDDYQVNLFYDELTEELMP